MTTAGDCCAAPSMAVPLALLSVGTLAYLTLVLREQRTPRGWSAWRTASFLAGAAVLALGLLPHLLPFPTGDFRKHMLEHLAIGMLAPIGLVMAAPMTLVLRSVPRSPGRRISRVLNSRWLQLAANPGVALLLNLGGMAALYFTPLYQAMMMWPALHYLVHLHFLAAGCLYCWVIAGPDPAPHRPAVPVRMLVLGVAVVIHSVLAQLLYAGVGVAAPVSPEQLRQGAELMYYGGDISEMLLAIALVTTWRPARTKGPRDPASRPRSGSLVLSVGSSRLIDRPAAGRVLAK